MKSFNEFLLTELFDKPYPIKWEVKNDSFWKGSFKTKNDEIILEFSFEFQDYWDITFNSVSNNERDHGLTNKGDEIKTFSTILSGIKEFITKIKPERIEFTADKTHTTSRARLYTTLVKKFASANKYDFHIEKESNVDTFILSRK